MTDIDFIAPGSHLACADACVPSASSRELHADYVAFAEVGACCACRNSVAVASLLQSMPGYLLQLHTAAVVVSQQLEEVSCTSGP